MNARAERGARAHLSGRAAEAAVERAYAARGCPVLGRRWRGAGGEIDLIVQDGPVFVFVEVKAARSHDAAAARITPRQAARVAVAAQEFLSARPGGLLAEMRFDVATVDGQGTVRVLENAFDGGG